MPYWKDQHDHDRHHRSRGQPGRATARRFGREGFSIALISRTQANVAKLAAELAENGVTARGYAANVREPEALRAALDAAAADLGLIEVLQLQPGSRFPRRSS